MIINKKRVNFYKKVFLLAALWNIIIALLAIVFYNFSPNFLFINPPTGEFFFTSFYILFFLDVFYAGIKYYKFSKDLRNFKFLIMGGMIGKFLLFFLGLILLFLNYATLLLFFLVLGDLIWAILFLSFRLLRKK